MDQLANVHQAYSEIRSLAVFVSPISVRPAIHVLITKFVSEDVVNIDAIMLYAVLEPIANNQLENVFVNHISLETQTIYVCHVSNRRKRENTLIIQKNNKYLMKIVFILFSNRNTNMQTRMWSKCSLQLWNHIE